VVEEKRQILVVLLLGEGGAVEGRHNTRYLLHQTLPITIQLALEAGLVAHLAAHQEAAEIQS
jgi:hypothetical protein